MSEPTHYAHCDKCGRVIVFDDWCYTHFDGWANCRRADKPDELDEKLHCAPLKSHPIEPQPANDEEAKKIPILSAVIGEDCTKHWWRKGEPMPVLTITL